MTLTSTLTCDFCGPVTVTLQVPDGTSLAHVADHLDDVSFESAVSHELSVHLDGLATA